MSNKQLVQELLMQMPEDISLVDIARRIEFMAAVRQGLQELDRRQVVLLQQVEQELPQWIIK